MSSYKTNAHRQHKKQRKVEQRPTYIVCVNCEGKLQHSFSKHCAQCTEVLKRKEERDNPLNLVDMSRNTVNPPLGDKK